MTLNPIFRKDAPNEEVNHNVRKQPVDKPKRATRSDKKTNIKIPLTLEERQLIRKVAKEKKMYPTHLCTYLIQRGLQLGTHFPLVDYPSSSDKSFPAKLNLNSTEKIDSLTIEWDCSRRQAAHRILITMLKAEGIE
ncbi:hypothetical protein AB3Z07_27865 (plasmid) [Metabacillus halosaccharovorans]|uniref:hypothetical protein n=1 Tax=Metabacillus halosaccharovorans TaxID=930124 RepID=UPI00203BE809|nr:hypothetical protein [Metabacillus halosaccharovorans]MCM3441379.1 hypothetical protein [Metabacillus halosaccharovorans]